LHSRWKHCPIGSPCLGSTTLHYLPVLNNNIPFPNSEMSLLQKGVKYNIHAKKRDWIQTLALEAETAIN